MTFHQIRVTSIVPLPASKLTTKLVYPYSGSKDILLHPIFKQQNLEFYKFSLFYNRQKKWNDSSGFRMGCILKALQLYFFMKIEKYKKLL